MGFDSDIIINIAIALMIASIVLPISMNQFASVDTSTWNNTALATLWDNLPLGGLLGLFVLFLDYRKKRASG